jgi:hypothetical protein
MVSCGPTDPTRSPSLGIATWWAKAKWDTYTLVLGVSSAMTVNQFVYKKMPYDPMRDLAPVTQIATNTFGVLVTPTLPAASINALVAMILTLPIDALALPAIVKLVKIDVEEHELPVLRGMRRLLERDHPVLIVETGSQETVDLLHGMGYVSERLEGSSNLLCRQKEIS